MSRDEINQPEPPSVQVTLADGSQAELRPIGPEDRDLIEEGLEHLSMEARIARFGMAIDHLSDAELDYLTQVDQFTHVAWGATVDGEPAAAARYIVIPQAGCAELAVVVVDKFRRRGLGRLLMQALSASARHNGVDRFCFVVHPENRSVLRMLEGIPSEMDETSGMIQGSIAVADIDPGSLSADYGVVLASAQEALSAS